MTKYLLVYTLFLMFVLFSSCIGQNQINTSEDKIKPETKDTVTSSVPNSMVRNVRQARNGDILVASWNGVFRYNGKTFTNITSNIQSPSFWDVLEDRKGNLWFATRDSGVYYYPSAPLDADGISIQHFTTKDGLANNRVGKIFEDKAGYIWFATGGGASRYDGKSFRNFTTNEGLSNNDLTTIMEDNTGKLWFGTRGEPCFYDGKTFTTLKNDNGNAFNNVWSIMEDHKGNIWFGDVDGLWRYDGMSYTKVSERGAYAIIQDKKGNIWTTGAINQNVWALARYDANSLYNKNITPTEIISGGPAFLGILEANDGNIWFGALGSKSGVHRYDGKTITDFKSK
ncbi:MAG TPA: two-component regulator propeller domain-containing protein [Saprospiraceae bacterium]|nr:two-component regulator propeller domain-containing protein [Saprospiraceae bacterium]